MRDNSEQKLVIKMTNRALERNPRIQCHDCGKWMRVHSNKGQLFFGGDSACGRICIYCIEKHKTEGTYKVDYTNCKRNCEINGRESKNNTSNSEVS